MINWNKESYIIFLHPRFFRKSLFSSFYKKIVKNLENRGIKVFCKETFINYQKNLSQIKLFFDDKEFPDSHVLYIHLFNGYYYNENIYCKKKIEKEREMLLLLAGKLGVREINYTTEQIETTFNKVDIGLNVKNINNNINYSKNISSKIGTSGKEIYSNRGAPVYILSNDINSVEENIKNKLGTLNSNIFSYQFYKSSPKLETFVHKRFEFKMSHLEYTIEVEDISDISFAVKTCFMDNGLSFSIQNNKIVREIVSYSFDFFTDEELRIKLFENINRETDRFTIIREVYDNSPNKQLSINYICDYVKEESQKCLFIENNIEYNCYELLLDYIKLNENDFIKKCENFVSTNQIKDWIYDLLYDFKKNFEFKKIGNYCYKLIQKNILTNQPTTEIINQPTTENINESTTEIINQPTTENINESTTENINESTTENTKEPIKELIKEPIKESKNKRFSDYSNSKINRAKDLGFLKNTKNNSPSIGLKLLQRLKR